MKKEIADILSQSEQRAETFSCYQLEPKRTETETILVPNPKEQQPVLKKIKHNDGYKCKTEH